MHFLITTGQYILFLRKIFSRFEKRRVYLPRIVHEINELGMSSIGFVAFISVFVGAVVTLQVAYNMENPLLPTYLIGLASRDSIILEFSPTMISLVLAGKIGSHISSSLGTMRVTEQIDALEVMGINSASFLVFPKICATIIINPFLIILSIALGIVGGWLAGNLTGICPTEEFLLGLQYEFIPFNLAYALIKTVIFAFIITTVCAFFGYTTKGGALEVGQASTRGVVYTSILIIICNYFITHLLLN
ncbi:MAG: ABC transporter permease [Flavobacteriales bacterium TMED191]|nr:MAG: ABC transporter permease [Flavobacteriales bacterium TMED191]|tara:strand:- start:1423 stop:2163 length:741 start_codon:yes stop_codon:yes gene_type:complete